MRWLRRLFGGTGETREEAIARLHAEIEREYPLEQMRAERRMRALQDKIARDERRRRLSNGGEYEHGIEGLQ
jgi:hypothetical protein